MNFLRKYPFVYFFGFCTVACVWFADPNVYASEGISTGRKIWDNVMLFVNFGILLFFFLKYVKKPLLDFLRGARDKIQEELDTVGTALSHIKSDKDSQREKLKHMDQRVQELRKSVLELGQKEKEEIIEQAKSAAEKMIRDAEIYSNYRLAMAKKALSDEMVDIAISMVEERLKAGISDEDNQRIIDEFVMDLESSTKRKNS